MSIKELECSGRLFFVSDIHGEINTLLHGLSELGFDAKRDMCIHAGDLIDRGSDSFRSAMHFIDDQTGAFHSVLGNHDVFSFENNDSTNNSLWWCNGGQWAFQEMTQEERYCFGESMKRLPYVIEVVHEGFKYGVVHAGVPEELTWDEFKDCILEGNRSAKQEAVWMRDIVQYASHYNTDEYLVEGVDFTIHGHTPVMNPLMIANRLHIDTGLVYGKYLTVTEVDEGKFTHHKVDIIL